MKKQKIFKIMKILTNTVFYTFIVLMMVFSISNIKRKRENDLPNIKGNAYMPIVTNSMEGNRSDSLLVGDLAFVSLLNYDQKRDLKIGDIIVYYRNKRFIIHRIIDGYEINGNIYVITKGDNTKETEVDSPILVDSVIAKYNGRKVANIGSIITYLQTPNGFLVGVLLPVVLILVYYLVIMIIGIITANKEKLLLELNKKQEEEREILRAQILSELNNSK